MRPPSPLHAAPSAQHGLPPAREDPMPAVTCGFGGPGGHDLYVTGRGVVYRIQTLNAGVKNRGK